MCACRNRSKVCAKRTALTIANAKVKRASRKHNHDKQCTNLPHLVREQSDWVYGGGGSIVGMQSGEASKGERRVGDGSWSTRWMSARVTKRSVDIAMGQNKSEMVKKDQTKDCNNERANLYMDGR